MTKRDLVVRIARETDLVQNDVAEIVQKTLDYITEELIAGAEYTLVVESGIIDIKNGLTTPEGANYTFTWGE